MVIYTILKPANSMLCYLSIRDKKEFIPQVEIRELNNYHSPSDMKVAETTVILNDGFSEYKPSSMAKVVNALLINILEIKMIYDTYPTVIYTDDVMMDSELNNPHHVYKLDYNKPISEAKIKFGDMRDAIVIYISECVELIDDSILSELKEAYRVYKDEYEDKLSIIYTKLLAKLASLTIGKIEHPFIYTLEQQEDMLEDRHFEYDDNRHWKYPKFISREHITAVNETHIYYSTNRFR